MASRPAGEHVTATRPTSPEGPPAAPVYPHLLALATILAAEPFIGARYLSVAEWLRQFDSWPVDRRHRWQQDRLEEVMQHAARSVPFYRRIIASGGTGATHLSDLPVVDKARIRSDMASFLSEGWETTRHLTKATGGTTGDPWRYPLDLHAWGHLYGAALHFWARAGCRYGERVVLLGSPPSLLPGGRSWKGRLRRRAERRLISVAGIEIDREHSLRRAIRAAQLRGALWYGYAGTIVAMADAVADAGVEVVPPRAIVTTSETLQPGWRQRIETAFGAPVYDEYGCNDGGVLAHSCRAGRYHVADSLSLVEVLDGDRSCPPGVEGDVTVTNLHARVLPFLRYKVGDRAVMAEGACPCGIPGTTFERVVGRTGDRIRLPGDTELSAISFGHVFKQVSHVRRWQVVQDARERVKIRLDVDTGFDGAEAERIKRYFEERCGPGVRIELTTTEPIERSAGGKHKIVVRLPEAR